MRRVTFVLRRSDGPSRTHAARRLASSSASIAIMRSASRRRAWEWRISDASVSASRGTFALSLVKSRVCPSVSRHDLDPDGGRRTPSRPSRTVPRALCLGRFDLDTRRARLANEMSDDAPTPSGSDLQLLHERCEVDRRGRLATAEEAMSPGPLRMSSGRRQETSPVVRSSFVVAWRIRIRMSPPIRSSTSGVNGSGSSRSCASPINVSSCCKVGPAASHASKSSQKCESTQVCRAPILSV